MRQSERLKPDVAVLDVRMPGCDGLEAARRITTRHPGTGMVMMSNYDDEEYIAELMKDGADGKAYLLKTSIGDVDGLVQAVESVAAGDTVLDPEIDGRLVRASMSFPHLLSYSLRQSDREALPL